MIRLDYQENILNVVNSVVKSCDTLEGSVIGGTLTLIFNMGVIYKLDVSDMFPSDLRMAIRKTTVKTEKGTKQVLWTVDEDERTIWLVDEKSRGFDQCNAMYPTVFYDEHFHLNPLFDEMRNGKTSEGGFRFILDTTEYYKAIFILYKGMFNMLKQDTLTLEISEVPNYDPKGYILWLHFNLYKSKLKKTVQIYCAICNLYRRPKYDFATQ